MTGSTSRAIRTQWLSATADLLPGLGQFQRYERHWLRADLTAGLTVAAYLVPQAMAYADARRAFAGDRSVGGPGATGGVLRARVLPAVVGRARGQHDGHDRGHPRPARRR